MPLQAGDSLYLAESEYVTPRWGLVKMSLVFVTPLRVLGAKKVFEFLNNAHNLHIILLEREARWTSLCMLYESVT